MKKLRRHLNLMLVLVYLFSPVTSFATIVGENDAPDANDDSAITDEDTPVTIDVLANDSDPDGDPLTVSAISLPSNGTVMISGGLIEYTPNPNFYGTDSFLYMATDPYGAQDSAMVDITVLPVNDPPICTAASPSIMLLWPPSHEFVDIQVMGVADVEGDPVTIMIDSIYQDEPVIGKGSGKTEPDGIFSSTDIAAVRSERDGKGDGRVYHISFSAADSNGGECAGEVMVSVPHDQSGAPAVDGGALYDSTGAP